MKNFTLKAMPFDAEVLKNPKTGQEEYDRVANSKDLADLVKTYFSNGILVQGGDILTNQLQVLHLSAMKCTVKPGGIIINGRTGFLESEQMLEFDVGTEYARIDRVVAELNLEERNIYIKVLKGIAEADPKPAEVMQTEDVYQIPLAQIKVAASSAIVEEVVDERPDNISNVTIGIKPPTGMDAETVKVSDETQALYGAENVDRCLSKITGMSLASYMAFVANVNTDSLDCAFGKNNNKLITGLGRQLAMYSWFKGTVDKDKFLPIMCVDTLDELFGHENSLEIVAGDKYIGTLVRASPYALGKLVGLDKSYYIYDLGNQYVEITGGWKKGYNVTTGRSGTGGTREVVINSTNIHIECKSIAAYNDSFVTVYVMTTLDSIKPYGVSKLFIKVANLVSANANSFRVGLSTTNSETTDPNIILSVKNFANNIYEIDIPSSFDSLENASLCIGAYCSDPVANTAQGQLSYDIEKVWFKYA